MPVGLAEALARASRASAGPRGLGHLETGPRWAKDGPTRFRHVPSKPSSPSRPPTRRLI